MIVDCIIDPLTSTPVLLNLVKPHIYPPRLGHPTLSRLLVVSLDCFVTRWSRSKISPCYFLLKPKLTSLEVGEM